MQWLSFPFEYWCCNCCLITIIHDFFLLFYQGSTHSHSIEELNTDFVEEREVEYVIDRAQCMEISEIYSFELKRDDIKFERLLGSGNFGEVYKATLGKDIVAVKSLKGERYQAALTLK